MSYPAQAEGLVNKYIYIEREREEERERDRKRILRDEKTETMNKGREINQYESKR